MTLGRRSTSAAGWGKRFSWVGCCLCAAACANTLKLEAGDADRQPHTTIPYTGVRNDAAQFADYSSIDASILDRGQQQPDDAVWRWR